MRTVCLLLIFFIAGWHVASGSTKIVIDKNISFKNAFPDPDAAPDADFKTLIVPIKRAGNLIIVEASIDTIEGNFILDTGAPGLVLNETYFRDYPRLAEQETDGINGSAPGFNTTVYNFKLLDLQYSRLKAHVTDLSFVENGRNIKILGLLGTRLFSKFAITIDLFRNQLYIQKLDKDGNIPAGETVFHDRFMVSSFQYLNDMIFLKGTINNSNLWFAFDTGAESSLFDYNRSKKMEAIQVLSRSKVEGIGGVSLEVVYARFDNLMIGDRKFMQNKVILTNLDKMSDSFGRTIDGILGYDFFVRGIFTINFVKKEFEMYIYTNQ